MSDQISKSWFAVFDNPELHGYTGTPQEIVIQLKKEWIKDSTTRTGAWIYCISANDLPHVHMVLEDTVAMRFSKIKKTYAKGMHFEETKGNKTQIFAYINKLPPFDEKGETIVISTTHGNVIGKKNYINSNHNILFKIEELLNEGKTPNEIMDMSIYFRKHEPLIRREFFARKLAETPPIRDIDVYWHLGSSGSGKSYQYVKLCENFGSDKIYMMNDYQSGLDFYCGEEILFMDEIKDDCLSYQTLLCMLQGYRMQIHCRYCNAYALWNTIHITSIYAPEQIYNSMVKAENKKQDSFSQLLRRITSIIYHWKDNNGYKTFALSSKEYINYEDLVYKSGSIIQNTLDRDLDNPFIS